MVVAASMTVLATPAGASPPNIITDSGSPTTGYFFVAESGFGDTATSDEYSLSEAANVTITVLDGASNVVRTLEWSDAEGAGVHGWTWDGNNDVNAAVDPGLYTIHIAASAASGDYTLDQTRHLVSATAPGAITSPIDGATLSGNQTLTFTPDPAFTSTFDIDSVTTTCFNTSSAPSGDGTWQMSVDTNSCANGTTDLVPSVEFTDPVGASHSWSGAATTVTFHNLSVVTVPSWAHEQYLFPAGGGFSDNSVTVNYSVSQSANVTVTVLNASHTLVRTLATSDPEHGGNYVLWDGTNNASAVVPAGAYTVHIVAQDSVGSTSADAIADVAIPSTTPGSITSPLAGATLSGTQTVTFTPDITFGSSYPLTQVLTNCFGGASSPGGDGTWQMTTDTNNCANGSTPILPTVYFTDPLGTTHSWSGPATTVTLQNLSNVSIPSWSKEAYFFPGASSFSDPTLSTTYTLSQAASVTVTIRDGSNTIVRTVLSSDSELAGTHSALWDGTDDAHAVVPVGAYTVEVDAHDAAGTTSDTETAHVASPPSPGSITSPSAGATLSGIQTVTFTPNASFTSTYDIDSVSADCFGAAGAPSGDGTWQMTTDTNNCANGSVDLTPQVAFRDPLGLPHTWSGPTTTVTLGNGLTVAAWDSTSLDQSFYPSGGGYSDTTTPFDFRTSQDAEVTVTVRNGSNVVVATPLATSELGQGAHYLNWDGTDGLGHVVPAGSYTIHIAADDGFGQASLDIPRHVEAPGTPGDLLSPAANESVSGQFALTFAPAAGFAATNTITSVQWCFASGGCASVNAAAGDGTWTDSVLAGDYSGGPTTVVTTVFFNDPQGAPHTWASAGSPLSIDDALSLSVSASPDAGVAPLHSTLTIMASDPSGAALNFTVHFGDGSLDAHGTIGQPFNPVHIAHVYLTAGAFTAQVLVSNGLGATKTASTHVWASQAPITATLTPAASSGAAPFSTNVSLVAHDPTGLSVSYSVTFGDGSAASGVITAPATTVQLAHTFTAPGAFVLGASLWDTAGAQGQASASLTATGNQALVADPGGAQTVVVNTPVTLDATGSQPSGSITAYHWTLGDGASASAASLTHKYAKVGTYSATLTVTGSGGGHATATAAITVVAAPAAGHGLAITVKGGSSPLSGATLAVITSDGTRYPASTNASGVGVIAGLYDGTYTAYAYADGYLPAAFSVTQSAGHGTANITLQPGSISQSSVSSSRLDATQIAAAGINPNDPNNQNVFKFAIKLAFIAGPNSEPVTVSGFVNNVGVLYPKVVGGDGVPIGEGSGGGSEGDMPGGVTYPGCSSQCFSFAANGYGVNVEPVRAGGEPALLWMIIPGEAHWLKEFFRVTMMVTNLAPSPFSLDNGSITLGHLPNGLSLAPTALPQSQSHGGLGLSPSCQCVSSSWVLRGDLEGYYGISGTYAGTLDPVAAHVSIPIVSPKAAIHVWGGSAVKMIVDVDSTANIGAPYLVRIGLQDVANVPVYNPGVTLSTTGAVNYIYQPDQQLSYSASVVNPGATFWTPFYRLVPKFNGQLVKQGSFVKKVGGNVDVKSVIILHSAATTWPTTTTKLVSGGLLVSWQHPAVAGVTGYEVFWTPQRLAQFDPVPLMSVSKSATSVTLRHAPAGMYAVSAIVAAQPVLYNSTSWVPNGSTKTTCTKAASTAGGGLRFSSCTPASTGYGSASANAAFLSAGGTLTWSTSSATTIAVVAWSQPVLSSCPAGSTEWDGLGAVTGGTAKAAATTKGDVVSIKLCRTATGAVSLLKGSSAIL
jgi:flagellar hook assembly protein FlgD